MFSIQITFWIVSFRINVAMMKCSIRNPSTPWVLRDLPTTFRTFSNDIHSISDEAVVVGFVDISLENGRTSIGQTVRLGAKFVWLEFYCVRTINHQRHIHRLWTHPTNRTKYCEENTQSFAVASIVVSPDTRFGAEKYRQFAACVWYICSRIIVDCARTLHPCAMDVNHVEWIRRAKHCDGKIHRGKGRHARSFALLCNHYSRFSQIGMFDKHFAEFSECLSAVGDFTELEWPPQCIEQCRYSSTYCMPHANETIIPIEIN